MEDLVLLQRVQVSRQILETADLLERMRAFLRTSSDLQANRIVRDKMSELEALAEQLGDRLLRLQAVPVSAGKQ